MKIDVNKKCFDWIYCTDTPKLNSKHEYVTLRCLKTAINEATVGFINSITNSKNNVICQFDKKKQVINSFSLTEAKRLLKLSQL